MDQLHLINAFVAVVDADGFAGAARKLGISPPAVTRAINELESQLGVRLLTRTTRVVRVTEPGARYAYQLTKLTKPRVWQFRQYVGCPVSEIHRIAADLDGAACVGRSAKQFRNRTPA